MKRLSRAVLRLAGDARVPAGRSGPARAARRTAAPTMSTSSTTPGTATRSFNGSYRHWQQGGHTPPHDDRRQLLPDARRLRLRRLRRRRRPAHGVDRPGRSRRHRLQLVGPGSYEDRSPPGCSTPPSAHGIKVAWHLEPYAGRTAASTVGRHQLHQQPLRVEPRLLPRPGARQPAGVLRLREPADHRLDGARAGRAQRRSCWRRPPTRRRWPTSAACTPTTRSPATPRPAGPTPAPSAGPTAWSGRRRSAPATSTTARCRATPRRRSAGRTARPTTGSGPTRIALGSADWVSITSFNEWHEGSTIEPASSNPPAGNGYQTYAGAYGTPGAASETAYLDRTRYWVDQLNPPAPTADMSAAGPRQRPVRRGRERRRRAADRQPHGGRPVGTVRADRRRRGARRPAGARQRAHRHGQPAPRR